MSVRRDKKMQWKTSSESESELKPDEYATDDDDDGGCGGWESQITLNLRLLNFQKSVEQPFAKWVQFVAQEAGKRIEIGQRVYKHHHYLFHRLAWDHFVHVIDNQRSTRVIMSRIVTRLGHRHMKCSFDRYAEAVGVVVELRRRMARVLARWTQLRQHRAFGAWLENLPPPVVTCSSVFSHHLAEAEEAEVNFKAMHERLHSLIQENMHGRQTCLDHTEHANARVAAEAERRLEICRRTVKRMLKHQLNLAWNHFVHSISSIQINRHILQSVLVRMQHRVLARAFDYYARAVHDRLEHRAKLLQAVARWREKELARTFGLWVEYMDMITEERETDRAEEVNETIMLELLDATKQAHYCVDDEVARRIQMAKRILKQMLHLHVLKSWNMFLAGLACVKHVRQVVRRVLARMTQRALVSAFSTLFLNVQRVREKEMVATRVLARWSNTCIYNTLHRWIDAHDAIMMQRLADKQFEQHTDLPEQKDLVAQRNLPAQIQPRQLTKCGCWPRRPPREAVV